LKRLKISRLKPASGKTKKLKAKLILGVTWTSGTLEIVADSLFGLAEQNENNNTFVHGPLP
jgi:hypothetical protein